MSYERRVATKSDDAAATVAREKRAAMMRRAHEALKSGATTPATLENVERHNAMIQKITSIIHQHADAPAESNTSSKQDLANVKANTLSAYNWDFEALKGCKIPKASSPDWWLWRSVPNAPKVQGGYDTITQGLITEAAKQIFKKDLAAYPGSLPSNRESRVTFTAEQAKLIISAFNEHNIRWYGPERHFGSGTPLLSEFIHENLKKVK